MSPNDVTEVRASEMKVDGVTPDIVESVAVVVATAEPTPVFSKITFLGIENLLKDEALLSRNKVFHRSQGSSWVASGK